MSTVTPCSKRSDWDWKKGDSQITTNIGGYSIVRDYFDCGEYFWDGEYNVVRFPKGMILYHGSAYLADAVNEYPLGRSFYDAVPFGTPTPQISRRAAVRDDNIPYQVSQYIPVDAGWYGDLKTAKIYSRQTRCGMPEMGYGEGSEDCILAYKLKEDTVFYLMDDPQNIWKLLNSTGVPELIKRYFRQMFTITTPLERTGSDSPPRRFYYRTIRVSEREWDIPFAKWMCRNILQAQGYAGMAAPRQFIGPSESSFHPEFIFCNATKYLERDLESDKDWQRASSLTPPPETNKLLETYKRFKTVNINTHGGNLSDHTVWSLLFYEDFVGDDLDIPFNFSLMGAIAMFLHDIGKMNALQELNTEIFATTNSNFVYYAVPQHPLYGYQMLTGELMLNTWPDSFDPLNPIPADTIDLTRVVLENAALNDWELGNVDNIIRMISFLVLYHWDFGDKVVKRVNNGSASFETALEDFTTEKCSDFFRFFSTDGIGAFNAFKLLLIVLVYMSAADVAGFSAYGKNRVKMGLVENVRSRYFRFIKNVPQKYRGSKLFETSNFLVIARASANFIKNMEPGCLEQARRRREAEERGRREAEERRRREEERRVREAERRMREAEEFRIREEEQSRREVERRRREVERRRREMERAEEEELMRNEYEIMDLV